MTNSPQFQANSIISSMNNFRTQAEKLCKNNEIRIETRLELVNMFGIQSQKRPLTFKYFTNEGPYKDIISKALEVSTYQEGSIEEIAAEISDMVHIILYQKLSRKLDHDEALLICVDVESDLKDAILEEYLEKFIAYIYE